MVDYRKQAMDEAEATARRQREAQRQNRVVRESLPGLARANPEGLNQHSAGLYAALQAQQNGAPAPGAQPGPAANGFQIQPENRQQLNMLEVQSRGFGTAADVVAGQNAGFEPPAPPPTALNVGGFGGDKDIYANPTPSQGFGNVIYSDSPGGAVSGPQGSGNVANAGFGPFGRTEEEQAKIAKRVGQYQSAIDLMRSLRGIPSERDRLTSRAGQRISLNQGIGGFANQVADRNFARDQLKALDARESSAAESANEAARLGFDVQQAGIKNALEQEKVNQGRFKLQNYTKDYDPLGRAIQGVNLLDTRTGAVTDPTVAQAGPISQDQALAQATKEADEALGGGLSAVFTSEKDVFGGKSKDEWIKSRAQELAGGGDTAITTGPQLAQDKDGNKIQWNPKTQKWDPVT